MQDMICTAYIGKLYRMLDSLRHENPQQAQFHHHYGAPQDMSQEQLEEMMQEGGSSGQEGQELQISLEQKEGGSAGKSGEQCVTALSFQAKDALSPMWKHARDQEVQVE